MIKVASALVGGLLLALLSGSAFAATLISAASGNIGTAATWQVIDTTGTNAFLNSETANTALTTSPVASSAFTPASETVTAIGVKLASVAAAPSGTLTVKFANSTSPGSRECTQTVNVADLAATNGAPTAATADGGWAILTARHHRMALMPIPLLRIRRLLHKLIYSASRPRIGRGSLSLVRRPPR